MRKAVARRCRLEVYDSRRDWFGLMVTLGVDLASQPKRTATRRRRPLRTMRRAVGAAILVLCFGSCGNDNRELIDPPDLAPPVPPPAASSVPFEDLTLEVGDSVVVESVEALFIGYTPLAFTAGSSDTTVLRASVREAMRLTITARAVGSADVSVTATEPARDPNDSYGLGPQGRSVTRTAKVTVIER